MRTATPDVERATVLRWLGPALVVAAGVCIAVAVVASDDGSGPETSTSTTAVEPAPVTVSAESTRYARIEDLAAASDLIVRAHVVEAARGRTVGVDGIDPAASAIVVRDLTVVVDEVLGGQQAAVIAPGDTVQVEEEGWLGDGSPLVVNGLGPSRVGDDSFWFLTQVATGADRTFITVNEQGRFVVSEGALSGATGDDPLVGSIEAMSADELTAQLRALGGTGP